MTVSFDALGRPLASLRISVTDRCNLRCAYCMPEDEYVWLPSSEILTFEELSALVDRFCAAGVERVRLTGGEPLIRNQLPTFVSMLAAKPQVKDLALTTNGVLLSEHADALLAAGLHRVTVSLDTLDPKRFQALTRRDLHARVLEGISAARFPQGLKLDTVVIRGVNDDELAPLLEYAARHDAELRFIEYMDVGGATRWTRDQVVSRAELLQRLGDHYGKIQPVLSESRAPAERFRLPDGRVFGIVLDHGPVLPNVRPIAADRRRALAHVPLRGSRARPEGAAARGRKRRGARPAHRLDLAPPQRPRRRRSPRPALGPRRLQDARRAARRPAPRDAHPRRLSGKARRMQKDFIEELTWRRMLHDRVKGTDELLRKERVKGYIGFDPTADSLGVGNLVQVMTLLHFQQAGHQPIALIGGATGMVGDPSGKSEERNLLNEETLQKNLDGQRRQLERFIDFGAGAELVNNYDWMKDFTFLSFIRDIGKHIPVNYMLAKDSVEKRLTGDGMSFTEFCYQLVQGYDFYWLWKNKGVKLQMGGSDQWGNILTGAELVRRKDGGDVFALTTPLIKKADGTKFGKTEGGNVWLDPKRTSPYEFYQFWLNASDEDVKSYVRIFTLLDQATVEGLETEHAAAPQHRVLQKKLAADITTRVHGADELKTALAATDVLFGKGTIDLLRELSEDRFVQVFVGAGVPVFELPREKLGLSAIDLATESKLVASKGEAKKLIAGNGLAINKEKVKEGATIDAAQLINGRYLLLQKGKKDYCLVKVTGPSSGAS